MQVLLKGYVPSAKNLNPVTTQLDVDIYDDSEPPVKVHVTNMKAPIEMVLTRSKWKRPSAVSTPGSFVARSTYSKLKHFPPH